MRVTLNEEKLVVFINKYLIKDYDYLKNDKNTKQVLNLILKISNIFNIKFNGLYDVKVFQNKKVGLIMEIAKYDDLDIIDYTDFRVQIYNNYDFLLEFNEYYDIPSNYNILIYDNKYYIKANDILEKDFIRYSDLYNIIYKDVKYIKSFSREND